MKPAPTRLLCFAFLLFLITSSIQAQVYRPSKVKQYLSLSDEVHILSFFIDTRYGYWEQEELDYFYKELLKSQEWLKKEASFYNQQLTFDNDHFLANKSIVYLDDLQRGTNPKQTINQIMQALNYQDLDDFLDYNRFNLKEDKLKIVTFVKSNSRSHAYNYWSVEDMDLAVVYFNSTYGQITDNYVISHELLHQFGAWDLYYERGKSQTEESGKKALENYPNDIMLNTHANKEALIIDELTAWRIGWTAYKAEFDLYDPRLNKQKILEERRNVYRNDRSIELDLSKKKKNDKG